MKLQNDIHKKLYAPWKFIMLYILGTLIIFIIGPWTYQNTNFALLILFMLIFGLLSSMFYMLGIGKIKENVHLVHTKKCIKKSIEKSLKMILVFSFIIVSFMLLDKFITEGNPFSGNLFKIMAKSYTKTSTVIKYETDIPLWIFINASPIIYSSLILGVYYFKELNRQYKCLIVFIYIQLFMYYSLFVGTQKTLGDLMIILLSILMINLIKKPIKLSKRVGFFIILILVVLFFSSILAGRLLYWNYSFTNMGLAQINLDNWMVAALPKELAVGFAMFIYYSTHGYYGLSLCLQLPFKTSFGMGSSFVIRDLASRYLGLSGLVEGTTYPERMQLETGWDAFANWHTIFPWIASDFTFIGAILIVSFSAFIYAKAWKDILLKDNWQSILMFTMLNIQWGYFTANNQLFQTKATVNMFLFTLIVWLFRDAKITLKPSE